MSIRNLLSLLAIPVVLAVLPLESRQFWFYIDQDRLYAEHIIYNDSDTVCIVAKNVGAEDAVFSDGSFGTTYYRESTTGQYVRLDSANAVYPHTTALVVGRSTMKDSRLVRIGTLAPVEPSTLRVQTPAEEELGIYLGILIMTLVATLSYVIVLLDRKTTTQPICETVSD